ncbi:MAG: hypothetical protein ACE5GQ_01925 [Nitrospinales bacterium]
MKRLINCGLVFCMAALTFAAVNYAWAEGSFQTKQGLRDGGKGFAHLQEMIALLELSLKTSETDSSLEDPEEMRMALRHAREALKQYEEALTLASESLGAKDAIPMMREMPEGPHEDSLKSARGEGLQPIPFKPLPAPKRPDGMLHLPGYEGS